MCRRIKAHDRTRSIPEIFVTAREEVEDEALLRTIDETMAR